MMDIDLELEYSDRISDFLRSKLQEIKSENAKLTTSLQHRQEVASKHRAEISKNNENFVKFGSIWKKTINGKYVFGLDVTNENPCALNNVTVTLSWTSSSPLTYKFHLISTLPNPLSDGLKCTPNLAQSGLIIIILDIPFFTDHLSYTISGCIGFEQSHKKSTVKFPFCIHLVPQDVTDNSVVVHWNKVIDGNLQDFLAVAFSAEKQEFVMVVPDNSNILLEATLEIDCGFSKIDLASKRKYFLANKIAPMLDGALLEIEDQSGLNIYSKDFEVTTALLHYLHKHLTGVVIVPKPLYQPDLSPCEITELLRNSLSKELDELESGDLAQLRNKMADLEQETDVLVDRLNKKLDR